MISFNSYHGYSKRHFRENFDYGAEIKPFLAGEGLRGLKKVLGPGLCDAGAEEAMVSHFDGVGESFKFSFIDVIYTKKVIGADAVDYCRIWQKAHNLDGKLVLVETGGSHFFRCLVSSRAGVLLQLGCQTPGADKVGLQEVLNCGRGERTLTQGPRASSAGLVVQWTPRDDGVD